MPTLSVSDYRRLNRLKEALERLREEISPKKDEDLDEYDAQKVKVNKMMQDIKKDLMIFNNLKDPRDMIEHKNKIRDGFVKTNDQITAFGKILEAMAKKKSKNPSFTIQRVKLGQDWMRVQQEELMKLAQESSQVDLSATAFNPVNAQRSDRRDEHRRRRQENRKRRRRKGQEEEDIVDGFEMTDFNAQSAREQEFMKKVEISRQQEEEMLQLISQGLEELHQLAIQLNKLLKQQKMLLDDVEENIDKVQEKLDSNNQRLTNALNKSGGMVRFIPFLICAVFLLALIAFIYYRM